MKKSNRIFVSSLVVCAGLFLAAGRSVPAKDTDLADGAADYIAERAHAGKKTRLALYPFTDESGSSNASTRSITTRIMGALVAKGGLSIIDPDKVSAVVEEQEKGLTGLVDPSTASETGKLIGADALVFGTSGDGSLMIRIIDSTTGEVLGATVKDEGNKPLVHNDDLTKTEARDGFFSGQIVRSLAQLKERQPLLFIRATGTAEEEREFGEKFPVIARDMSQHEKQMDRKRVEIFTQRKNKLLEMRKRDPEFDRKIADMRASVIEMMEKRREGKGPMGRERER